MSLEQRQHPGADMVGFMHELMAFVGLDETEVATIRRTAPVILRHEQELTTAIYEHFLKFPATAQFFLRDDGTPDMQRLDRRKHSLARWLRETAEVAMTHEFVYFLLAVSLSHSHRATGPGGTVPPQFMVATMSIAQTAFARLLQAESGPG